MWLPLVLMYKLTLDVVVNIRNTKLECFIIIAVCMLCFCGSLMWRKMKLKYFSSHVHKYLPNRQTFGIHLKIKRGFRFNCWCPPFEIQSMLLYLFIPRHEK